MTWINYYLRFDMGYNQFLHFTKLSVWQRADVAVDYRVQRGVEQFLPSLISIMDLPCFGFGTVHCSWKGFKYQNLLTN